MRTPNKTIRKTMVLPVLTPPRGLDGRQILEWKRNQALYATFDYLHEENRTRYDDTIEQLEALFFLSERRVIELLRVRPKKPAPPPLQGGLFETV